jgi:hypothetical protein
VQGSFAEDPRGCLQVAWLTFTIAVTVNVCGYVQNATAELRMAAFLQTAVAEADAGRFETVLSWWTQSQPMQVSARHCTWHGHTTHTLPPHPRPIEAPPGWVAAC